MAKNLKTRGFKAAAGGGRRAVAGASFGNPFTSDTGGWAAAKILAAANGLPMGQKMKAFSTAVLRTNDTLRHEEWKHFDEVLVQEALIQLKGVADLQEAGLVRPVPNSLGKLVFAYEKITYMDDAIVSMDGLVDSDNDRQEYEMLQHPLPMTHKDFFIPLRQLVASRDQGEPLDTTQVRTAGRLIAEKAEDLLFNGAPNTFQGLSIYGYTSFPTRHQPGFVAHGNWDFSNFVDGGGSKTSQDILNDVQNGLQTLENDRMYGPYWIYVGRAASQTLNADYIPNATTQLSTKTIRDRILDDRSVQKIQVVDKMPDGHVVIVNATLDTAAWVQGETLQTVQWDEHGGMKLRFKAFQIGIPLLRSDAQGRTGIVDMHS